MGVYGCDFEYDPRWPQLVGLLVSAIRDGDEDAGKEFGRIMEDRDVQLETFIEAHVTCDCDCADAGPPQ
jgi:hypothetical protein